MKRFYQSVAVVLGADGYEIHLDGRAVKLPETRQVLSVAMEPIAQAVAAEWDAQTDEIIPDSMPMMQIVSTCLERVSHQRSAMTQRLLSYVDTDLLFYRADKPPELVAEQERLWNPVLQSFEHKAACSITTTTGLNALKQPAALHDYVRDYVEGLSDEAFTVLQIIVPLAGSVLTGVAFVQGDLDAAEVMSICRVEERHKDTIYDAEKYGPDPSIEKADKAMMLDLVTGRQYLNLLDA